MPSAIVINANNVKLPLPWCLQSRSLIFDSSEGSSYKYASVDVDVEFEVESVTRFEKGSATNSSSELFSSI